MLLKRISVKSLQVYVVSLMLVIASAFVSTNAMAEPGVTNPSANSTLSGTSQTFTWSADDVQVDQWWLYIGTSVGGFDILNSGDLGTDNQYNVIGIPVDGTTIYARLWYRSGAQWRYQDTTYTAAVTENVALPAIVSPADGSEVSGGSLELEWRDNNTPVNYWWLYAGSSQGANDIYNSGPALRNQTSVTIDDLPAAGSALYVRLWFRTTGMGWRYQDTRYISADDDTNNDLAAAENLALIKGNATRNTQYDDNAYKDIPVSDISVSDLTTNDDIYNEALLDTTNSGYFRVKCEVSHFAYDDPIVHPNQPGRAHLHMFFGNTNANAYSTFDSLLNTGTGTCNGEDLNRTAYWVPALLDSQGNALLPDQVMVYYKNDNFRLNGANELVNPFPDNLRMISGNAAAVTPQTGYTGAWQAQPAISFSCGPAYNSNDKRQALIPDCFGNGNHLEMQIAFPQCVNEELGTYQSDQSHISYSENGYYGVRCPDSHPTDISSIMYRIFFNVADYGGSLTNLHLSSDVKMDRILPGGTTAHADWYGAWHPDAMDMWVQNCNNTQADCETGLLDRDPAISLVLRKRGFYARGYRAPAAELVKLCPGKTYDPADPLRSVAMCRMN